MSIYGKERKSSVDLEIGKTKEALIYFPRQLKGGGNCGEKLYKGKNQGIMGKRIS